MQRLIQWFRERLVAIKNWIFDKVINTRGGYFVVGLVIGSTLLFIYLVGTPYYQEMTEGYDTATKILIKANKGQDGESLPDPAAESIEVKNSTERETSPEASAPTILKKVVDRVYEVETQKGTDLSGLHGKCKLNGKSNGYSYAPGTCYSSDKDLEVIVLDWFNRKTQEMSLEEAICLYGGAGKVKTCNYLNQFNLS